MVTRSEFRIISICAGVGGLDLGIRIAVPAARTVCSVERESYAAATLVARMEDQAMDPHLVWDDIFTFDGLPWRGRVHCIAAGLPCQPYSVAGKQLGHADERALWPEFIRVVGEVQPWLVFIENVAPFLGYFRPVGIELSRLGYVVEEPLFVTAEEVGGSHERERLFILAHRNIGRFNQWTDETESEPAGRRGARITESGGGILALTPRGGFGGVRESSERDGPIGGGGAQLEHPASGTGEQSHQYAGGGSVKTEAEDFARKWPTPKANEEHGEKYTPPQREGTLRKGGRSH